MEFRVLAKGYTEAGVRREQYDFRLLCSQEHAERVARLYLTHLQGRGGMWSVKTLNQVTGDVVFDESNYVRPLENLINVANNSYIRTYDWTIVGTTTTSGTVLWDDYARRTRQHITYA